MTETKSAKKTLGAGNGTKVQTKVKVEHSRDAKRRAASILEVLAGARTPMDAAAALGVSLPRYYLLETRALEGLIAACEPRARGKVRSADSELAALRKECERLRRESARSLALARASQRTVGLTQPPPQPPRGAKGKRRRRRPVARALMAATRLLTDSAPATTDPPMQAES